MPMSRIAIALAFLFFPTIAAAQTSAAEAPTREALRATLAEHRAAHLAELRRYAEAGAFPINDVQPGLLRVFEDPTSGDLCAVANLIASDRQRALVDATAATDNHISLIDVHEGPLYDWILSSGFTQEEIDRIQEPDFYIEVDMEQQVRDRAIQRERHRLQRALNRTLARLERSTARSLDLAVDRLLSSRETASS